MRILIVFIIAFFALQVQAQLYVLKDHRPDSAYRYNDLYDSLPAMCDTFYRAFITEDIQNLKPFVPQVKYLKSTFDTLAREYRGEQVLYRQQLMLRLLQKEYKKVLKYIRKNKIKLKKIERKSSSYEYGKDDDGNRFCYVTVRCVRRKHTYELKYLAILLNKNWFLGDDVTFVEIE